ncbi:MAG TPA: hypothetical protein VKX28_10385 [Xanthobacteraceae bacterium]|nr:hypothetical protein [Xanthobacteraceae bacterium]
MGIGFASASPLTRPSLIAQRALHANAQCPVRLKAQTAMRFQRRPEPSADDGGFTVASEASATAVRDIAFNGDIASTAM